MLLYILSKNKLTETFLFMNTFVFVVCFNSFPSIRFLICVGKLPFARVPSCDSLPILPHRFHFCQAFLIPFSKYFSLSLQGFSRCGLLGSPSLNLLAYLTTSTPACQLFFKGFYKKFNIKFSFLTIFRHYIYDFGTCGKPATNAQHVVFTWL